MNQKRRIVYIDDVLWEYVQGRAAKRNISMSSMVRHLIEFDRMEEFGEWWDKYKEDSK